MNEVSEVVSISHRVSPGATSGIGNSNAVAPKVELDFQEITRRLKALTLPEVDLVVGIASGGIVPASLAAFHLGAPLSIINLNFRDEENRPRHEAPTLLEPFEAPPPAVGCCWSTTLVLAGPPWRSPRAFCAIAK